MSAKAALKPICVVFGKNAYGRRQAVDRVIKRELAGGDPALNLSRVDGDNAELAEVLDDVRTFSMLGDRRVVVVDEADSFISKHRAALERFVSAPAESGCLILICNAFDGRTRLYKAVKKVGEMIECRPLQGRSLMQWLTSAARDVHGNRAWFDPVARSMSLGNVWNPMLLLVNQHGMVRTSLPEVVQVESDGTVKYRQRYVGTVSQPLDLARFPRDTQKCTIQFISARYGPDELTFLPDTLVGRHAGSDQIIGGTMAEGLSLPDWTIVQF